MEMFPIKQGSLWPPFQATITTNRAGNLSGATAAIRLMDSTGATINQFPLTIDDAAVGTVHYQWIAGDTDNAGTFWLEVWVTFGDGILLKIPDMGYVNLIIQPDAQ